MPEVFFFALRRATPKFNPPEKDEWSIPGAESPDEALVYFAKDVGCLLARVENDTSLGEFVLEQRERILTPYGASVGIQSGAVVADWWVERAKR